MARESQLTRIEKKLDRLEAKVDRLTISHTAKIAKLEVKSGIWGALAGAVAAAAAYLGLGSH